MTTWFDRLNLQPQERRMVLAGLVVIALVLNYWVVWPYFADWKKVNTELNSLNRVRTRYLAETTKTNQYNSRLRELQTMGEKVSSEDAPNRLQGTILAEANTAGVQINRLIPLTQPARLSNNQTNQFFEEYQVTADVASGEKELVEFLYKLGSGDSMIRVRDVNNLRLDPSQTRLTCSLTLVASFPRRVPAPPPPKKPLSPVVVQPKVPVKGATNKNVKK